MERMLVKSFKGCEVGVFKKVYKIYPKEANMKETKEYQKVALVTKVSDQIKL